MATGEWGEWGQHVLHELVRLDECYKAVEHNATENYNSHKTDAAKLRLEIIQSIQALKEEMLKGLENIRLEQLRLKMKVAIIAAILTTVGNGILFLVIKAIIHYMGDAGISVPGP